MAVGWDDAALAFGTGLAGMFGGGDQYDPGKLHTRWMDPYQGALFQQQMQQGMSGAGDFGFGQAAKSGTSQLQQMMADRGIAQDSGVGLAAQGGMMANAMSADIGNRRNYMMGLMNARPNMETSDQGWESYGKYGRTDAMAGINAARNKNKYGQDMATAMSGA